MLQKKDMVICLGSSCFARGNKQMVYIVKKFLEDNQLTHKVNFKGKHCFGNCENGPSFKINGHRFDRVGEDEIVKILEEELLK